MPAAPPCPRALALAVLLVVTMTAASAQHAALAPTGTLRIAYLASNPAQAIRDADSGETRGVAIDIAGELARRFRLEVAMQGLSSPQRVIDAVAGGEADLGFVAYNPEREGPVAFSHPYMLVHQTFLVSERSRIRSVGDIDRAGQKIGATRGDSIALYLARTLRRATLVELTDTSPADVAQKLRDGTLDAFGANRQRLTTLAEEERGLRVLRDNLYAVEQAIIVPTGSADALAAINQFIDEIRESGFLSAAIERSGVAGLAVAPAAKPARPGTR